MTSVIPSDGNGVSEEVATTVREPMLISADAGPLAVSLSETFLASLWALITVPGILFLITIGLLYPRRFIAAWHFMTLFALIFVVAFGFHLVDSRFDTFRVHFSGITEISIVSLAYVSMYTIVAYVTSTIGTTFSTKVYNIQKVFNRLSNKTNILFLVVTYAIAITPLVALYAHYSFDLAMYKIWTAISVSLIILIALPATWLYERARSLPARDFIKKRSDNYYLLAIILALVVVLIIGDELYG